MTANNGPIVLEPVANVTASTSVCHFDELEASLQEAVIAAHDQQSPVTVSAAPPICDGRSCDVVKFTDYYELSVP